MAASTTTVYRRNNHLLSTSSLAFPSSPTTMEPFNKFNSALNQGLLNPMSPPPPSPPPTKPRSSPTLFEMMANEPELNGCVVSPQNPQIVQNPTIPTQLQDSKQSVLNRRLEEILAARSPGNLFDDSVSGDVKLTLSSKDGVSVCLSVHARVLVENSRFFALKLNENNLGFNGSGISVEIADCEDVEVYVETLRLMYCRDLRKKLVKEDVGKVLGVLKVSAAIGFDAGVLYCLEYLEAAPWSEEEEDKVASLLSELQLEGVGPREVLKRVSLDVTSNSHYKSENEEILLKLLQVVLEGKDEKARREMKSLVTKMLRESNSTSSSSHNDLSKESLYSACDKCLASLRHYFLKASESDLSDVVQITRQADNLHWLLDILIDRQIAEDFLNTWASLKDLSEAHSKVPPIHRYEISRVTARLFVGIGKGQLLASKEARCRLLTTWLVPFYEDFGWMRRASKGLDRHVIEEGLSSTILTLPMSWQQEILMSWFDRFVNAGEDCPNIQRGFEVWWRRAFSRRNGEVERPRQVRAINVAIEN